MADNWYELVQPTDVLNQGDILIHCPIVIPDHPSDYSQIINGEAGFRTTLYFDNLIVLTQGCQIAGPNGPKVNYVTVAPIADIRDERFNWNIVNEVRSHKRPGYHLISKSFDPVVELNYQIVEFVQHLSIPYQFLKSFIESTGPRLRLKSPYVEELSQRFGLFFSKIGLPNDTIDVNDLKNAINPIQE